MIIVTFTPFSLKYLAVRCIDSSSVTFIPVIAALSVSLGTIIFVTFSNLLSIVVAGAGFRIVVTPCFFAIVKADIIAEIGVSN